MIRACYPLPVVSRCPWSHLEQSSQHTEPCFSVNDNVNQELLPTEQQQRKLDVMRCYYTLKYVRPGSSHR